MLLYKFKGPAPFEHTLDILLNERLFCCPYAQLNDPFEGQFMSMVPAGGWAFLGGPRGLEAYARRNLPPMRRQVELAAVGAGSARVCSLTASLNDVRMWSLYADGHRGWAVELDLDADHLTLFEVDYRERLSDFGHTLLTGPSASDVLRCKTEAWRYEQEYRLIQDEMHFDVKGRIRRVILGVRVDPAIATALRRLAPANVHVDVATLDGDAAGIRVGPGFRKPIF